MQDLQDIEEENRFRTQPRAVPMTLEVMSPATRSAIPGGDDV
jgi:hypothetical protein